MPVDEPDPASGYHSGDIMIHTVIAVTETVEQAIEKNQDMVANGKTLPLYLHREVYDIVYECFLYNKSLAQLGKSCLQLFDTYPPIIAERPAIGMYKPYHDKDTLEVEEPIANVSSTVSSGNGKHKAPKAKK